MNLVLFLAFFFLITYLVGRLLEKIRIPWLFSALLIGTALSISNPFHDVTSSPTFKFLADLGMIFLLFIIGFELDLKKTFLHDKFVFRGAIAVILAETIVGTALMYYVFHTPLLVSILLASSSATVGESILLPILDEFNLTKTKLGRSILGVGILDDAIEILIIIIGITLVSHMAGYAHINIGFTIVLLAFCVTLVALLVKFHKKIHTFKFKEIPSFFLLVLFFIFMFVGMGMFVEAGSLGAILAGITLRNLMPAKNIRFIDSEIRTLSYGFLAPLFFLWVGLNIDFAYVRGSGWLIFLVATTTAAAKILASYVAGRKVLGARNSVIAGIALTVKLSTSVVIMNFFYQANLISSQLYSTLVAASILFTILVPLVLPLLIKRWNIHVVRTG